MFAMLQCFESFQNFILNLTALPPAILTLQLLGDLLPLLSYVNYTLYERWGI